MKHHLINEVGNRYGKLVVLERDNSVGSRGMWICKCDCGNLVSVSGALLRNKNHTRKGTQSCGCLVRLPVGESSFNAVYLNTKASALKRGYEWSLTKDVVKKIHSQPCFYCGAPPSQVIHRIKSNGEYIYNGIDRVDNAKGYTIDNVVPCCGKCNRAKFTYSTKEFIEWVESVHNYWSSTANV